MGETKEATNLKELERLWDRWTRILAQCVGVKRTVIQVSPQQYRALHAALLEAFREHGARPDTGSSPTERGLAKMDTLCRPWISLDSLKAAEKQILFDLLQRCQQQAAQIFVHHPVRVRLLRIAILLLLAAACTFVIFGVVTSDGVGGESSFVMEARSMVYRMGHALQRIRLIEWLGLVLVPVILIGIWMLSRTRRY